MAPVLPASFTAATDGSPAVPAPSARMVSTEASAATAALTLARISVGSLVTGSTVTLPPKPSAKPLQRRSSDDVADLLVDAEADLAAHFLQLRAGDASGLDLVLADMKQRAELLRHVGAGVHRDHRNARGDRLLDRGAERRGVRDRDDEAGRLLVHGRVDELAHRDHVEGFRRAVIDLDLHVLAAPRRRRSSPPTRTDRWPGRG